MLGIHRRDFCERLIQNYDGIHPIVRDNEGSILIPMPHTPPIHCAMYIAPEDAWFNVAPKPAHLA